MAPNTKRICLTQYLQYGNTRLNRKSLELSLGDIEIRHYICRKDDSTEVKEDFELLSEEGQGLHCLAIIHTQNGFACLEALVEEVSVPLLGKGFDDQSAHAFRVKPSAHGASQRSTLQLRPGEPFYIQDLALTLVPEESHEHLVHLASGGAVPSYDEYSQHVSQIGESQHFPSPSPGKFGAAPCDLPVTPTKPKYTTPGRTPLVQQMAASDLQAKDISEEWPQRSDKRAVLHTLRKISQPSENEGRQEFSKADGSPVMVRAVGDSSTQDRSSQPQHDMEETHPPPDIPNNMQMPNHMHVRSSPSKAVRDGIEESPKLHGSGQPESAQLLLSSPIRQGITEDVPQILQLPDKINPQASTYDNEIEPPNKKPRLAYSPEHESTEESEDSLAGETIEVAPSVSSHTTVKTPRLPQKQRQPVIPRSSILHPQTPSVSNSLQQSPSESIEYTSSIRSTRSALKENSYRLNMQLGGTRILFASSTSVGDSKAFKKFLAKEGVEVVQNIKDASCLCVGKGELKKTSKLISAVALGKEVITDDWVTDSARLKELQDVESYRATDPQREKEWGIKLDEAIARGKQKVQVFKDLNMVFTAKARKELGKTGFADLKDIVMCAGARTVETSLPKGKAENDSTTVVIGSLGDLDTPALTCKRFYNKDIISLSVLRGNLDLENDEFVIMKEPSQPKGNKKRKR